MKWANGECDSLHALDCRYWDLAHNHKHKKRQSAVSLVYLKQWKCEVGVGQFLPPHCPNKSHRERFKHVNDSIVGWRCSRDHISFFSYHIISAILTGFHYILSSHQSCNVNLGRIKISYSFIQGDLNFDLRSLLWPMQCHKIWQVNIL